MAKATIIQKTGNSYKLDANGAIVYRAFTRLLSNQEETDMLKDVYNKKAGKIKKEKTIDTNYGQINKSKKKEFNDFVDLKLAEIEAKRLALNV